VPKGLLGSPGSSSIDGEYEFNEAMEDDVEDEVELVSGDEFDSEEEEEMSMEVRSSLSFLSLLLRACVCGFTIL